MKNFIIPVCVIVSAFTIVSCADHETTTTKETTTVKTDTTKVIKDSTKSDYNPATPATQNAPY